MNTSIRRGLLVAAAAALAVTLGACSGQPSAPSSSGGEKKPNIAVVLKEASSEYWITVGDGARAAGEKLGDKATVSVTAGNSEADYTSQINRIQNAITAGADVLVVAPSAPTQLTPVLQQAIDKGIKVILVDTPIDGLDASAFVGTDNVSAGKIGFDTLSQAVGGKGQIGIITGAAGITSTDNRVKGFLEGNSSGALTVVATLPTEPSCARAAGVDAAENLLTAHPDLVGIFSACGDSAAGAVQAIARAGKTGDIKLVSFDLTSLGLAGFQDGSVTASVNQDPERMGGLSVESAYELATGGKIESQIDSGVQVLTKENAAEYFANK